MAPSIGFVLVTHRDAEQVLFLCERLTALYDGAPIAVHNDFHQSPLDTSRFPSNVKFVKDWGRTRWGGNGVIEGERKALRLLYEDGGPDWFVVLSGMDYPIKPAQYVLEDLERGGFDAYVDHRLMERCELPIPHEGFGTPNFSHPAWVRLGFERYMAIGFGFYKLATKMGWKRKAFYLRSKFFVERFTPFKGDLKCYAGDYWATANRKAAQILLAETEQNRKLIKHFQTRPNPTEVFHQTLLCNSGLKVCTDNKRFANWTGCTNHPKSLVEGDYATLVDSTDHFARKFNFDPIAMKKLDEMVDSAEYPKHRPAPADAFENPWIRRGGVTSSSEATNRGWRPASALATK